jgi:hypothetical protein
MQKKVKKIIGKFLNFYPGRLNKKIQSEWYVKINLNWTHLLSNLHWLKFLKKTYPKLSQKKIEKGSEQMEFWEFPNWVKNV